MSREHFDRLASLFEHARELDPGSRAAYLDRECAEDAHLRTQVDALLSRHDAAGLLDEPVRAVSTGDEPVPDDIGGFRVLERIGRGGMGTVYRAEQDQPRRVVALKVMHAGLMSRELLRRFEFETSVLGRLQHAGIAQIYEAGTWDDGSGARPFFAMELVDGVSLDSFLTRENPTTDERLRLFIAICDAVTYAHQKGVIHRDLKPANILVTADGVSKILDFGVARATDVDVQTTLHTAPGQILGTLAYMSPEQVAAAPERLDTRSDVYALGVILYEMLAGRLPYDLPDASIASAARVIEEAEPTPLTTINRSWRGDLNTIVLEALRKQPEERYQTAADLAADVRRYLDHEPIVARPATALYQMRMFARRNRGMVAGAVLTVLVLFGGIIATTTQAMRATREKEVAEAEAVFAQSVKQFLYDTLTSVAPEAGGSDVSLREALDRAADKIEEQQYENERVEAEIRMAIGNAYERLGLLDEADAHLTLAVEKSRSSYGPRDLRVTPAMVSLAAVRLNGGRYAESEEMLQEVRELTNDDALEHVHPWAVLRLLAGVCEQTNRPKEAEVYARRGWELVREHEGQKREQVLLSNALAAALYQQDRFDEAEEILLESLELARGAHGDGSDEVARALNMLAIVYSKTGRLEEGVTIQREIIAGITARMREGDPSVGGAHYNLGMLLFRLERYEEAEPEMRLGADIMERALGREHPATLTVLAGLGNTLVKLERVDEAEPILREVLEARDRIIGPEHPDTVLSLLNMSTVHRARSRYDEASALIQRAIETRERARGRGDRRTLSSIALLAQTLHEAGDREGAEPYYREVYQGCVALLGPAHAHTIRARDELADVLRELDRHDEADRLAASTPQD